MIRNRRELELLRLEDRNTPSLFAGSSQVNTVPLGALPDATQSVSASSTNGQAVVVWTRVNTLGRRDVFAQLYKPDRTKLGSEITVTNAAMDEYDPGVAMDGSGNFVVAWTVLVGIENRNVLACRFNGAGFKVGPAFAVSAMAAQEAESSVARSANGSFIISYTIGDDTQTGITARRYSAAATLLGALVVIAPTPSIARVSSVAANATGQFAVAYQVGENVFLKRYSPSTATLGVHTIANGPQFDGNPSVDIANNGSCVVAWESSHSSTFYPNIYKRGVSFRTVSATGILGAQVVVWKGDQIFIEGEDVGDNVIRPMVAMDRTDGDFVVVAEHKGAYYGNPDTSSDTKVFVAEVSAHGSIRGRFTIVVLDFDQEGGAENALTYPAVTVGASGYYFVSYVGYDPSTALGGLATLRRRSGRLL